MAEREVEGGTDSHKRGKVTVKFGELILSSDFDSGNLDRVEECKSCDADTREFNLWTAPDCAGTEFENCNRTWFFFSVSTPANYGPKIIRFNVQNLNKQSRLYQQGLTPMIKTVPGRGVWERLRDRVEYEPADGGGMKLSFQLSISESRRQTTYVAFCFPFSYTECQRMLAKLEAKYSSEVGERVGDGDKSSTIDSRIYFHRELLCYSLENRRVDLITVSSWEGISDEREVHLPALFPDHNCVRARIFVGKKVFYLTSRVHPGESPSSHVFNGFLHFILRSDDPRAQVLRRHFVFKLIPMLNPDGVFHGHYRTDTRGMNLNRVYLDPSPELHPSIFAARSLMLHYHSKGHVKDNVKADELDQWSSCDCDNTSLKFNTNGNNNTDGGLAIKLLSVSDKGCSCVCSFSDGLSGWCSHEAASQSRETSGGSATASHSNLKQLKKLRGHVSSMHTLNDSHHQIPLGLGCSPKSGLTSSSPALLAQNHAHKDCDLSVSTQQVSTATSTQSNKCINDRGACQDNEDNTCRDSDANSDIPEALLATKRSGIAFYVDLHAHATKRGVFMYGNYFGNAEEQAENMVFPKVISLNSPHLDFEHCVFSEKNMYTADKRDGLSKEGSGRVAMHKATGIIHCYTLECNYNSGRQSNALTAATLDNGRASPSVPYSPMGHRFSIQDFEQVGRALAISALDMYQLNPWSRLPTTEYGSVAGIRQSLLQRIRTSRSKKNAASKRQPLACPISQGNQQQSSCEQVSLAGGSVPTDVSNQEASNSPSMASLPSSSTSSSVEACRALLLKRQKTLAAINGSDQIAVVVAQVTEAKRKPRGRQIQLKGGPSPYPPLQRVTGLRTTRSTSLRRQHIEKQGQANAMKASLHQVVFPLSKPLRLPTDSLKDPLSTLASKDSTQCHNIIVSSSGDGAGTKSHTQLQSNSSQYMLKLPRKKLLNCRSRNVLLKQSSGRSLAVAQNDRFPQETANASSQLTVSDSEIICKLSRPARLRLRHRAFTSTQSRH